MTQSHLQIVQNVLTELGYKRFGFAPIKADKAIARYENWINQGYQASMEYLKRHLKFKKEPSLRFPKARYAITLAFDYYPHPMLKKDLPIEGLRVAMYARGYDYHEYLEAQVEPLLRELRSEFPNESFEFYTDSKPILERDLAERSGLGWVGKNTCLIDKDHGSLFFIAEILTSLNLESATLNTPTNHCGTCSRCIDACPTDAITKPYVLDANKCISFLTIEKKNEFSAIESSWVGNWLFGCDICQSVCPWNEKVFGKKTMQAETHGPDLKKLMQALKKWLEASDEQISAWIKGTPLSRAKPKGLRRNLEAIAQNLKVSQNNKR